MRNYFLTERSLKKFFARSRVSGTAAILSANPFVHPVALSINCFRGIRLSLSPLPPCSIVPCPHFANCILRSYIVIKPSSTSCSLMSVTVVPLRFVRPTDFPLSILFSSSSSFFPPPPPPGLYRWTKTKGPLEVRLRLPGFLCRVHPIYILRSKKSFHYPSSPTPPPPLCPSFSPRSSHHLLCPLLD